MKENEVMEMVKPPKVHWFIDFKKDIKTAGMALWMYVGIQICSGMSIAAALYMFGENVFMLVMTIASALAVILFLKSRYRIDVKEDLKGLYVKEIVQGLSWMLLISLVWGIISILINAVLNVLGLSNLDQGIYFGHHFFGNVCLFVTVVFAAPIAEELVFRGLIFKNFARYHVGFAMVFSSFCFACMHMNVVQGIPTFFMGLVLSYFYWKTKSLKTCIGIHMLNNAIAMLSMVVNIDMVVLVLEGLGIYYLIQSWSGLKTFAKNQKFTSEYMSYVTQSPIFQGFFLFFIGMAVISLF